MENQPKLKEFNLNLILTSNISIYQNVEPCVVTFDVFLAN